MASSDFNWMSLVGSGVKLGLKGAVGATATYAMAWALDSIFGLEVGKPGRKDQKEQLIDELQQITGELQDIDDCLLAIDNDLQALSLQMQSDFYKTLSAITTSDVLDAVSAIEASWQKLEDQANQSAAGQAAPDGFTAAFAEQVLVNNDGIQYQLNILYNSLLPVSNSSRGQLDYWTTTLILQIQQGASRTTSYQWLEQSFLQYVHYLYYGHGLMLMAKMRETWNPDVSLEDNQSNAQQVGLDYLQNEVAPKLTNVCDFYMQCVHRLILSNYMVPNNENTGFLNFLSQSDVDLWLSRSTLLTWLITQPVDGPSDPGVMVTSYLRPSQISSNGTGPTLAPGGDYEAQAGALFALQYGYDEDWYKVVDFTDEAQTELWDVDDSNIRIAEYAWPSPTPQVGTPVGDSGVFSRIMPSYYDKTTLSPTSNASANTVVFGYTTDMSGITDNLAWNMTSGWEGEGASDIVTGDHDSLTYNRTFANDTGGRNVHAWLKVDGRYKDDALTKENYMLRLLSYNGGTGKLRVYFDAGLSATVTPGGAPAGYSPVPVTLSGWAEVPQRYSVTETWSVSTPEDDDPPATMSHWITQLESITAEPGQNLSVSFVLTSTAEKQDWYKNYSNGAPNYNATNSDVQWQINALTLAWAQPTVSVS